MPAEGSAIGPPEAANAAIPVDQTIPSIFHTKTTAELGGNQEGQPISWVRFGSGGGGRGVSDTIPLPTKATDRSVTLIFRVRTQLGKETITAAGRCPPAAVQAIPQRQAAPQGRHEIVHHGEQSI